MCLPNHRCPRPRAARRMRTRWRKTVRGWRQRPAVKDQGDLSAAVPGVPFGRATGRRARFVGTGLAWIMLTRPTSDRTSRLPETDTAKTNPPAPSQTTPTTESTEQLEGWIVASWAHRGIGRPDLWLFSPDGQGRHQVTNDPRSFDVQPCFAPDGRRLAFVRGRQPDSSSDIWICNVDGSAARKLVAARDRSERLRSPVWAVRFGDPLRQRSQSKRSAGHGSLSG